MSKLSVRWLSALTLMLLFQTTSFGNERSIGYYVRQLNGVSMHIVVIDIHDPQVRVTGALASGGIGRREGFNSMMHRLQPTAALTGTFFSIKSNVPVGDIVIGQLKVNHGRSVGTSFGVTTEGLLEFGPKRERYCSGFETLFSGGISLIRHGKLYVKPWSEGFRDRSLYALKARTAVARTNNGKLLLIATNHQVHLTRFAQAIKKLGVSDAVAFDGGASTGLHYRGSYLARPQRGLTNVIIVYESNDSYWKHITELAPGVAKHKQMAAMKPVTQISPASQEPAESTVVGFGSPFLAWFLLLATIRMCSWLTRNPKSKKLIGK